MSGLLDYSVDLITFDTEFETDRIEFGCKISIYRTPEENAEERALYIGSQLADLLQKRVLVPFTHPDYKYDPYFDIVFEKGQTFLVDDNDTNFADGTAGRVMILEEYKLPDYRFDSYGRFIGAIAPPLT